MAVLTYNFAKAGSDLADHLANLPEHMRLDIVTNIPNRWPTYYRSPAGQNARNKARESIATYLELLDPLKFKAKATTRFNFNNHGKIVATDACAYVGSANFTGESGRNVETGTLLTTRDSAALALDLFDGVAAQSILNPGSDAAELAFALNGQAKLVREITEELHRGLFAEADHGPGGRFFYHPEVWPAADVEVLAAALRDLDESLDAAQRLYESRGHGLPLLSKKRIRDALELITDSPRLRRLATFDPVKSAQNRLEENAKEAYDENLEYYAQAATEDAEDERQEVADAAHDDVLALMRNLDALGAEIASVEIALTKALVAFDAVDNA